MKQNTNNRKEMHDLAHRKVEDTYGNGGTTFQLETFTSSEASTIKNHLIEAVASLETIKREQDQLKAIKETVKEDLGIDKKTFGTLASEIQKGKFEENNQHRADVSELHDIIQTVPVK